MDFMEDPERVRPHLAKLDGTSARFFETQFFSSSFDTTHQQILMRLWGVLSKSRVLERMFSHPQNRLDFFRAMNKGSVILINTAKDLLQQEGCSLFGKFCLALLAQATQERETITDETKRLPTIAYIDEAHDYFEEGARDNNLISIDKYPSVSALDGNGFGYKWPGETPQTTFHGYPAYFYQDTDQTATNYAWAVYIVKVSPTAYYAIKYQIPDPRAETNQSYQQTKLETELLTNGMQRVLKSITFLNP